MSTAPQSPLATPTPWDLVSAGYESDIVPVFEGYARDALELARVDGTHRVLDVAAGPGTLSLLAAERAHHVEAIDFAPAMIERLARRVRERSVTNVTACVGDGQALPYADESFDAGFSMFGLMFFPDRAKGFAELRRVLRPGGTALVSSWHPVEAVPAMRVLFTTLRELIPMPAPDGPPPLSSAASVREEMEAAGFRDVEVHTLVHEMKHESLAAMFASMERSMAPIVLLRTRLGAEAWAPLAKKLRDALVLELGEGACVTEMPAYVGMGRR
ncbi:MAG: class I SAM-dependent methyltransferase [Polyangiales bacterium]